MAGNLSEQRVIIGTIVRKDFRDRLVSLILKKDLPIGTVKAIERQTGIKFK